MTLSVSLSPSFSSNNTRSEPQYWYWEMVEMLRKMLLIGGVLVLQRSPSVQALFGILVTFAYIVVLANLKPFEEDATDFIAQIGSVTMCVILLLGSALSWWDGLKVCAWLGESKCCLDHELILVFFQFPYDSLRGRS